MAGTLRASSGGGDKPHALTFAPEIARCDATREGSSQDYETTTMVVQPFDQFNASLGEHVSQTMEKGDGHARVPSVVYSIMPQNSGKDYKARIVDVAQPIMAAGPSNGNQGGDVVVEPLAFDTTQITSAANRSNPQPGDPCHPLSAQSHPPAIAFSSKDYGADASYELSPTLRAGGHSGSHQNGGVMPAIAFNAEAQADQLPSADRDTSVNDGLTVSQRAAVATTSAVRRLTPTECERLQGFPDGYTDIPWRGKPTSPDGPRYKALGNSWAVPKFTWLGRRIAMHMPARQATTTLEAA